MSKFDGQVQKIVEVVGLEHAPIAGRFSDKADSRGDSARELRVCEAFDVVRRERVMVNLSNKNCACAGGLHYVGISPMPSEKLVSVLADKHKIHKSAEIAMASIKKKPLPIKRGNVFVLGPLERFEDDPDLVILFVNAAQADRILGLASFEGAEPFMYYPASNICSTITNTLAKGKPEINFVSVFERRSQDVWSPNELIIALPLKDFERAVESIPHSGYGTA